MTAAALAPGAAMTSTRRFVALALLGGVFVMDGYDLNAMALAVPRLEGALGLAPTQFGVVFSAVLVGLGAGAALVAPLGDRIGRRPLITISCLIVAAATLMTAMATSITEFALWRFITGLALGACLPNCTALSAELAPPRMRATIMSLVASGIVLGAVAAGESAQAVVAMAGWEGLFFVPGAFAAVLAVALWFVLPAGATRPAAPPAAGKVPQFEVFRQPWTLPFAVFATALTLNAGSLYMLTSWTPTVLPQAGFTLDEAARVTGRMQGAGLLLGMAMSVLIDRWRPGLTMVGGFSLMTLCFLAIGLTAPDPARWTLLLLVGVGCVSGAAMALPALTAYLFPSHMLSTVVGMGVLIARIGAIAGPLVGQAMLSAEVSPRLFIASAALPAGLAALVCLAIPAALAVRRRQEQAA